MCGDINCHVGHLSLGEIVDAEGGDWSNGGKLLHTRQSEDVTPPNLRGLALDRACCKHGLLALNGRCGGDPRGSATFVRGNVRTVLDFALVPQGADGDIRVVQPRDRDSDHRAVLGRLLPRASGSTPQNQAPAQQQTVAGAIAAEAAQQPTWRPRAVRMTATEQDEFLGQDWAAAGA